MPASLNSLRTAVSQIKTKSAAPAMATVALERDTFPIDDDFKEF